ncbi:MAG: GLUG motif-containing protein, partial [Clostridia bacterium]
YQIKTTADLQGMQAYYNEYDLIDEYYWILVNDIDISTDANGLTINWCPIGYEGGVMSGFNGHFDGNGKIISGLTITAQYENVGLFGRMASNATITNLNVNGTILWDQATNVGGVVGLIEDGATLTNCTFNGTITGYLNSGNYAVVGGLAGKYSMDAITGIANYDAYVYGTSHYTTFERFNTTYTTT